MKTVLVTSAITFVPDNYDDLVLSMAANRHIEGLIVIDNRSWKIIAQALILIMSLCAPRLGIQLLKNHFDDSFMRKKRKFEANHKKVWLLSDINSEPALKLLEAIKPDLILNARTRSFYKKKLLQLPKIACINIHHGLLPDQRGLMCDFWAHLFDTKVGFSIHQMTSKLDDGLLLAVQEVQTDKKDYLHSLKAGAVQEAKIVEAVLEKIANTGRLAGKENIKTDKTTYRTNPKIRDFYKLRFRGIKI